MRLRWQNEKKVIDRIRAGGGADPVSSLPQMRNAPKAPRGRAADIALLEDLCDTMRGASLCALGGFTPYPVLSAIKHFPQDFGLAAPEQEAAE